jgi:hypothetical protein
MKKYIEFIKPENLELGKKYKITRTVGRSLNVVYKGLRNGRYIFDKTTTKRDGNFYGLTAPEVKTRIHIRY